MKIRYGISRRRFLSTAAATSVGAIAMPYLSRAADRPSLTHGVQSGDVGTDGGVVWARADRPSQMMVEVATTESFNNARALPPIAALPEATSPRKCCWKTCLRARISFIALSRPVASRDFERAGSRPLPHRAERPARRQLRLGRRCRRTRLGHQSRRRRHVYLRRDEEAPAGFPDSLR
jgi:PhoD-like phosphatase, N-terminal domain